LGKEVVVLGEQVAGRGRQKYKEGKNISSHVVCVRVLESRTTVNHPTDEMDIKLLAESKLGIRYSEPGAEET
jgi:hypothetical protein